MGKKETALDRARNLIDDFIYEWDGGPEPSTRAAERLLTMLLADDLLVDAKREFLDRTAKGLQLFSALE